MKYKKLLLSSLIILIFVAIFYFFGFRTPISNAAGTCDESFPHNWFHVCYYGYPSSSPPTTSTYLNFNDESVINNPGSTSGVAAFHHSTESGGDWWPSGYIANTARLDYVLGVWRGNILFPEGDYQFIVTADDGVRLDIGNDGTYEIDEWRNNHETFYTKPISLNGNTNIKLEWYQYDYDAEIIFKWRPAQSCNSSYPVVATDNFHVCFYDIANHTNLTTGYNGINPATGAFIGEKDNSFIWSSSTTVAFYYPFNDGYGHLDQANYGYKDNYFAGVWRGNIDFSSLRAGSYKFQIITNDGARLDIGDDGSYEINEWTDPPIYTTRELNTSSIYLDRATKIKLEWYEHDQNATIQLSWELMPVLLLAPVANFSANPTSGPAPLIVNFTDSSTNNPTSWAWDFNNDGTTDSTLQNPPSYTYTTAGTYTVKLTVSNTSGSNSKTQTIAVNPAPQPDLTVFQSPTIYSGSTVVGNSLIFKGTIKNQGSANAGSFSTVFYLDIGNNGTWDSTIGTVSIDSLAAGVTREVISSSWTAQLGIHNVKLCADPSPGQVSESDENNNCATMSQSFTVTAAPQPDLIIENLSVSGTKVVNQPITLSGTVKNIGSAFAADSITQFKINDSELVNQLTGTLAVNGTKNLSFIWTPTATGNYTLKLCADKGNTVGESNENNNCSTTAMFTIELQDTTPPEISLISPTATLPSGTTETTLKITTNENAICKYSVSSDAAYDLMPYFFAQDATGTSHNAQVKVSDGNSYTYFVRCEDYSVNHNHNETGFKISFSVAPAPEPPPTDSSPPYKVEIIRPSGGTTVSGIYLIKVDALDDVGISKVEFYLDEKLLGTNTAGPNPYSLNWSSTTVSNGSHSLFAKAFDTSNNHTTSALIWFSVFNDETTITEEAAPPIVSFISPPNNSVVAGIINILIYASDNVGVSKVDVYLDGAVLTTDPVSPYLYGWDTTKVSNGPHTLYAVAYDTSGNLTVSDFVLVNISNGDTIPPIISIPIISYLTYNKAIVYWATDELTDAQVEYGTTISYGTLSYLYSELRFDHYITLAPLEPATTYYYRAISKDTTGNISKSSGFTFTTNSLPGAMISGKVVNPQGDILTDLYGWAYARELDKIGPPSFGGPVEKGIFSFSAPPGSYEVNVDLPAGVLFGSGIPQTVTLIEGQSVNIAITVRPNDAIITGYLKDDKGNVIIGVPFFVFVSGENGAWQKGEIDTSTGKFTIRVAPGTWYIGFHIDPSLGYIAKLIQDTEIIITSGATITKDIILLKADAIISGRTTNSKGQALANVWVSIDTESFVEITPPTSGTTLPKFFVNGGETDSNGNFSFSVPAGAYYIHAFLPPDLGLINPGEVGVTVSSGTTVQKNLVFRASDSLLSGKVTLDGVGTNAFVFTWSEKGGFTETRSDVMGNYSLRIATNDVWHVMAKKESGTDIHQSTETVITVTQELSITKNLVLVKSSETLPAPVATIANVTQVSSISLEDGAKVYSPPNALGLSGEVSINIASTIELPSGGITNLVGVAYNVEVRDTAGRLITSLNKDVAIGLPYADQKLQELGITADDLTASSWDETAYTWKKMDNYTIDKTNKLVTITTSHLTYFALVAPARAAGGIPPEVPTEGPSEEVAPTISIKEGDLIRGPDGIKVYIINNFGYKRHIFNPAVFNMYGHLKWGNIKSVDQTTLDYYVVSDLYRADRDYKVYSLEEVDEIRGIAIKHWIDMTPEGFVTVGYSWNQIFIVNEKERDYYKDGLPLTR